MFYFYLLGAGISAVSVVALYLVWRQDKAHVFTRTVSLTQLAYIFPSIVLAAWRGNAMDPSGSILTVVALCMAMAYALLVRALVELEGKTLPWKWQWGLFFGYWLGFELVAYTGRVGSMGGFGALLLFATTAWFGRSLWASGAVERVICVTMLLLSLNSIGFQLEGPGQGQVQAGVGAVLRLIMIFAFLIAAMNRTRDGVVRLRNRFEMLSAKSLQGIVVTDGAVLHYANAAAMRIFGHSTLEEALNAYAEADAKSSALALLTGKATLADVTRKAVKADGTELQLRISSWPILWDGKPAAQIVFIDNTEANRVQQQLQAAKKKHEQDQAEFAERSKAALLAANALLEKRVADRTRELEATGRAKSEFVANMSHEIRTPMNAVLGLLQLLQGTDLAPEQQEYALKAERAGKSLLSLLNDVLDFSKIEAGKLELDIRPFEVERLLRDLSVMLAGTNNDKPLEFVFDIDAATPPMLMGDSMRLLQVLMNLTSNAIKFTALGEVLVRVKVLSRYGSLVALRVSVVDSGIGIAPQNLERIFEVFSQAEGSITRRFGGTGLGLAICRRLLALMNTKLHVESTPGKGSHFFFEIELPVVELSTLDEAPAVAAPQLQQAALQVLVVDDNPVALDSIVAIANAQAWRVDAVASGSAAIARVQDQLTAGSRPYDLVVVDWHMDGMDGWQTLKEIKAISPAGELPVAVMLSTLGREHLVKRTAQEQAMLSAYLVKPVTPSMLAEAVNGVRNGAVAVRKTPRPKVQKPKRLQGLKILVVEDNALNQLVARELLTGEGAAVTVADNGAEGVSAVAGATEPGFDLVLMDMQMPVMDGCTATRSIRNLLGKVKLPVVAMTANTLESDRAACLAAGMNDHVGKPFDIAYLVEVILRWTGKDAAPVNALVDSVGEVEIRFDAESAIANMASDNDLYALILQAYLEELRDFPDQLDRWLAAGDVEMAHRSLHTLKGTSATVGAMHMMRVARAAERQLKEGGPSSDSVALALAVREAARETVQTMQVTLLSVSKRHI